VCSLAKESRLPVWSRSVKKTRQQVASHDVGCNGLTRHGGWLQAAGRDSLYLVFKLQTEGMKGPLQNMEGAGVERRMKAK
jgi:hypothetical protein